MRIALGVFVAALLVLGGCKGPGSVQDAAAKVAVFHQRLDAGDIESIWKDSGPEIQGTDKQAFDQFLSAIHGQLGKVRETKQVGWSASTVNGNHTAELIMQTTFERGSRKESFVYKGSGEQQKLAGYHIE
jgi:hypothetical protein